MDTVKDYHLSLYLIWKRNLAVLQVCMYSLHVEDTICVSPPLSTFTAFAVHLHTIV